MSGQNCVECNSKFIPVRNPHQRYCNQRTCQNARKRQWRKQKLTEDPDYRENRQRACRKWQNKNPHYWRDYRASHPEYIQINRQQQKIRDKRRTKLTKVNASHLAKSDALEEKIFIKSGIYKIFSENQNLAKSDALTVKITLIT